MLYFLSPCAYTTAQWIGDESINSIEVGVVIATAIQMQICERDPRLPLPNPDAGVLWWKWAIKSAYNLEWLLALYSCQITLKNNVHFSQLTAHSLINPAREYHSAFPTTDFTYPLNPEKERERYVNDVKGKKIYRRLTPPFWLKNRQVVIGLNQPEPVDECPDY